MMHAYHEMYLDDAMRNLGEAFDYALNDCAMEQEAFMEMFMVSGFAEAFGKGIPKYVSGMSGTELVWSMVETVGFQCSLPEPEPQYDYSPEYWCGWSLAYYQWYTGRSFKNICKSISIRELQKLYPTLHEASEEKLVSTLEIIMERNQPVSGLQQFRRLQNYSQKMLAEKSGVSLRMIQQYEQGQKDINKASAVSIYALSRVLNCRMEDLLDFETQIIRKK